MAQSTTPNPFAFAGGGGVGLEYWPASLNPSLSFLEEGYNLFCLLFLFSFPFLRVSPP